MAARKAPWYAFLYRLLGAHGTFWLWVVTVVTLWWTWEGAVLSMVNRFPERRSVGDAAHATDLKRWVVLPGVRLVLDGQLLLLEDSSDFQGTEVLIDSDDPAAKFWRTTRTIAVADSGERIERLRGAAASCSDVALAGLRTGKLDARHNLTTRLLMVQRQRAEHLPKGEWAVLLLSNDVAPTLSTTFVGGGGDTEAFDRLVTVWRDAVLKNVRSDSPQGLLVTAPGTVVERVATNPGANVGKNALRVNRTPSDGELYTFCGAALVFLFLATGLWGVVSPKDEPSP